MLYEAYTEPEPHFAQLVHADVLKPIEVYPRRRTTTRNAIWAAEDAKVDPQAATRTVEGKVFAIRTYFEPGRIQVQEGDTVILHITNAEQARDEIHGFGLVVVRQERGDRPGRDQDAQVHRPEVGRVSVLLHQLLLGAAPGDAGIPGSGAAGPAAGALRTAGRA